MPQKQIALLDPGHMPAPFQKYFCVKNGGFDVVVGNPPWKQLMVDELRFWASSGTWEF